MMTFNFTHTVYHLPCEKEHFFLHRTLLTIRLGSEKQFALKKPDATDETTDAARTHARTHLCRLQAFDAHARDLVAGMLSVYMTGGFTYIARDLIVRVFYTIGETKKHRTQRNSTTTCLLLLWIHFTVIARRLAALREMTDRLFRRFLSFISLQVTASRRFAHRY